MTPQARTDCPGQDFAGTHLADVQDSLGMLSGSDMSAEAVRHCVWHMLNFLAGSETGTCLVLLVIACGLCVISGICTAPAACNYSESDTMETLHACMTSGQTSPSRKLAIALILRPTCHSCVTPLARVMHDSVWMALAEIIWIQ